MLLRPGEIHACYATPSTDYNAVARRIPRGKWACCARTDVRGRQEIDRTNVMSSLLRPTFCPRHERPGSESGRYEAKIEDGEMNSPLQRHSGDGYGKDGHGVPCPYEVG